MFKLNSTIARDRSTDTNDSGLIKMAMTALGYYDDTKNGLSPYGDDQLFDSIRSYQKERGLKVDGIVKPDGPTQQTVKDDLVADQRAGGAFQDFWRNFQDMKKHNIIGADKYFHCKANYEASKRGWLADKAARALSDVKELKDTYITGHPDSAEDHAANYHGRQAANSGQYRSAQEACAIYRPEGISEEY